MPDLNGLTHQDLRPRRLHLQPLVEPMGSRIASGRITVDGLPVGYWNREQPDNDLDSGWRFFASDRSAEGRRKARRAHDLNCVPPSCHIFSTGERVSHSLHDKPLRI